MLLFVNRIECFYLFDKLYSYVVLFFKEVWCEENVEMKECDKKNYKGNELLWRKWILFYFLCF